MAKDNCNCYFMLGLEFTCKSSCLRFNVSSLLVRGWLLLSSRKLGTATTLMPSLRGPLQEEQLC